jgi:3-deoxy-D-manno-octulosonate 8-phosphate phosphatase (KDO 8-P phosphatase)
MHDRLAKIKLLVMDVDGTLTEGEMVFLAGEQVKVFNVYDGLGIRLAINYGLNIAWVTGNVSQAVTDRARTLAVTAVHQGVRFKSQVMSQIADSFGLSLDEIAYIGDDLNDLPAFEKAGFCFAVSNAVDEVKDRADMVTIRAGGHGAVREAIETILTARGEWEDAVNSFLKELEREDAGKAGPEAVA